MSTLLKCMMLRGKKSFEDNQHFTAFSEELGYIWNRLYDPITSVTSLSIYKLFVPRKQ